MRYDIPPELIEEQIKREGSQRDAALGRRFNSAQSGFLGPVISRWINSSVSPVAVRVRHAAERYLAGDMASFGRILDTPVFGLATAYDAGSPEYLTPILQWCLKGGSPGRLGDGVTFAEDLVLAALGRTVSDLALRSLVSHGKHLLEGVPGLSLALVLSNAASTARETALGQFITYAQGAAAMGAVRRPDRSSWAQRKKMNRIAGMLSGQVRHALESEARGEIALEHFGARTIIKVIDPTALQNGARRISVKAETLEPEDWMLASLATFPKGEEDPAKNAWLTFAMLVLCAAQVEHGWFDLTKALAPRHQKGKGSKGRTRYLILAEKPRHHLKADLARWIGMGFAFDPMIIPPPDGTYLTVKTKAVTGRNGPHGWRTNGEGTTAWELAGDVMAATPWCIARETIEEINLGSSLTDLAHACVPDETARRLIMGAYQKDAIHENLFLPLYMDFRGRIYTRTTWVSYQGNDLQKGLLRFPRNVQPHDDQAVALHVTGLMGFDKKALPERMKIYHGMEAKRDHFDGSEDPIQLWTALDLMARGQCDSIPIQVDGTCNGLQHLSAMFRDHEAAPWVNLAGSSLNDAPSDLYIEVAGHTAAVVALHAASGEAWAMRFQSSGAVITRGTVKRPVMVLPYGGTMVAIEEGVTEGVLAQSGIKGHLWSQCLKAEGILDPEAIAGNYLAFADRELKDHPLFKSDMRKLGNVVYEAIKNVIPKAMDAMDAFRSIASMVGDRSLEWSNGVGDNPMWIIHAYPKSERRTNIFRGFHLPDSVRGLAMKCGRDDINPAMHRTGIVANFIHSQDAAHLVTTMHHFRYNGGVSFGANHDCLYTRSSEAKILGTAVRTAMWKRYEMDPLMSPVRLRAKILTPSADKTAKPQYTEEAQHFGSWYALAKSLKVDFPERGRWKPEEVLDSAWFFS
jgi:hypothetical protein